MRSVKLFKAMREVNNRTPDAGNWPKCYICLKDVDSVNKEDQGKRYVVLRAKHHGAEDVIRVEFDWDMRPEDERIPMRGLAFFPVDVDTRFDEKVLIQQVKTDFGSGPRKDEPAPVKPDSEP